MIYRKLGNTDIDVSLICLGTMTFGEQNNAEESESMMDYAFQNGINFFDTAELYAVPPSPETQGRSEEILGDWMEKRQNRQSIVLATKITGPNHTAGLTWIRPNLGFSKEAINEAIEKSLQRLKTDYIDLYQLHWPERRTNFFGQLVYHHDAEWEDNTLKILESLAELVKTGKVRYIGLSNETPWGLMRFLHLADKHNLPRVMSVQNPYSLLNRTYEVGLAEMSIRETVGLLAYSPLAFGLLSGKYHLKQDLERDRLNVFGKRLPRYSGQRSWNDTTSYLSIAEKYGLSLTQLALGFVNSRDFVTSNIIGVTTLNQLRENLETIHVQLSVDLLKEVELVHNNSPFPAP